MKTGIDEVYTPEFIIRFSQNINLKFGCWEWKGYKTKSGYGQTSIGTYPARAHRVSFEIFVGKIPDGLCVLHRCDNPPCVNPNHLFLGTQADNAKDKSAKGRSCFGEKNKNAKLSDLDVLTIRRSYVSGIEQGVLATMYGVDRTNISCIVTDKTWKHLPSVKDMKEVTDAI